MGGRFSTSKKQADKFDHKITNDTPQDSTEDLNINLQLKGASNISDIIIQKPTINNIASRNINTQYDSKNNDHNAEQRNQNYSYDYYYTESQERRDQMAICEFECSEVYDNVFVGGSKVASSWEKFQKHNITRVVNCSISVVPNYFESLPNMKYLTLNLLDGRDEDISWFLCDVVKFIIDGLQNQEKVLIHCEKGISRSCSYAIAFYMYSTSKSWKHSFDVVKHKRAVCNPNIAFTCNLKEIDDLINGDEKNTDAIFRYASHLSHDKDTYVLKLCRSPESRRIVTPSWKCLNPKGIYVLRPGEDRSKKIFMWLGSEATEEMARHAYQLADKMIGVLSRAIWIVIEKSGHESADFREILEEKESFMTENYREYDDLVTSVNFSRPGFVDHADVVNVSLRLSSAISDLSVSESKRFDSSYEISRYVKANKNEIVSPNYQPKQVDTHNGNGNDNVDTQDMITVNLSDKADDDYDTVVRVSQPVAPTTSTNQTEQLIPYKSSGSGLLRYLRNNKVSSVKLELSSYTKDTANAPTDHQSQNKRNRNSPNQENNKRPVRDNSSHFDFSKTNSSAAYSVVPNSSSRIYIPPIGTETILKNNSSSSKSVFSKNSSRVSPDKTSLSTNYSATKSPKVPNIFNKNKVADESQVILNLSSHGNSRIHISQELPNDKDSSSSTLIPNLSMQVSHTAMLLEGSVNVDYSQRSSNVIDKSSSRSDFRTNRSSVTMLPISQSFIVNSPHLTEIRDPTDLTMLRENSNTTNSSSGISSRFTKECTLNTNTCENGKLDSQLILTQQTTKSYSRSNSANKLKPLLFQAVYKYDKCNYEWESMGVYDDDDLCQVSKYVEI